MRKTVHGVDVHKPDDAGTPRTLVVLWALLGSALVWTLHFGVSYIIIAWTCTTERDELTRPLLFIVSIIALVAIGWSGFIARRHWHNARRIDRPKDDTWDARLGERTARTSFIMVNGIFLAILFAIAVLYETSTIASAPVCAPGVSA